MITSAPAAVGSARSTRTRGTPLCRLGDYGPDVLDVRIALACVQGPTRPTSPAGQSSAAPGTGSSRATGSALEAAADDTSPDPLSFDVALDHAVRAFQQTRGLAADGIVGPETRLALADARWKLGDRILAHSPGHDQHGDDVADLQSRLIGLGLGPERVDGVFGPLTDRAVRNFQRGIGLPGDGIVGPDTLRGLAALRRAVGGGAPHALRERETLRRSGRQLAGRTIVLDPGHGGPDLGYTTDSLIEADLVLDLARRIEGRLVALGVTVALTRMHGDGGDDIARADLANSHDADLVVSLHADAAPDPAAHGISTYYYGTDRFGAWSVVGEHLAELLLRELTARTGMVDCRSHARGSALLQRTRMPAVRVEIGHPSNEQDAAALADAVTRDAMAEGVVVAIQRLYLGDDDAVRTGVFRLSELRAFMADLAG